jgi:tetratricopeptide (TPR) repeat protein
MAMALADIKEYMNESQKATIYMREAKALMDGGEFLEATECLDEAISLTPHQVSFYLSRAACHKALHLYTEAYYDYTFLLKLEPGNASHHCARGLCLSKLKRPALALQDFDAAIELEPMSLHYKWRAVEYADNGQHDKALKDLHRAIQEERDPSSELKLRCLHRRAGVYYEMKRFPAAMKDLMAVLLVDPANTQCRAMLGKVLKMMHDLKKAEAQINQTIKKEPDYGLHYAERGDIRFQMNNDTKLTEAIGDFDRAVVLLEDHNARFMKSVMDRTHAQLKLKRRRYAANSVKMGVDRLGPDDDEDDELLADDATSTLASLNPDGSVAETGDHAGPASVASRQSFSALTPLAKSQLRQAQIKDYLFRKLHGELLPGSDKTHAHLFHAAAAAGQIGRLSVAVPGRSYSVDSIGQLTFPGSVDGNLSMVAFSASSGGGGGSGGSGDGGSVDGSKAAPSIASHPRASSVPPVSPGHGHSHSHGHSHGGGSGGTLSHPPSTDGREQDQDSVLFSSIGAPHKHSREGRRDAVSMTDSGTDQDFHRLVEAAMVETHEQLADVLFRRAQAKLLSGGYDFNAARETVAWQAAVAVAAADAGAGEGGDGDVDDSVGAMAVAAAAADREAREAVEGALADASRASALVPTDEEYRLLVASCLLRLGRCDDALMVVADVIRRIPNNEKARYLHAYGLRLVGKLKDAVDELTHIIDVAHVANVDRVVDPFTSNFLVPPERVLETRGIIRRLLGAHEDALSDLERSVQIDDRDPRIFFLIGDSKSLLGDFEQAVEFFNHAEAKGYTNLYDLVTNRGMAARLLGRSADAMRDFFRAAPLMPKVGIFFWVGVDPFRLLPGFRPPRLSRRVSAPSPKASPLHPLAAMSGAERRRQRGGGAPGPPPRPVRLGRERLPRRATAAPRGIGPRGGAQGQALPPLGRGERRPHPAQGRPRRRRRFRRRHRRDDGGEAGELPQPDLPRVPPQNRQIFPGKPAGQPQFLLPRAPARFPRGRRASASVGSRVPAQTQPPVPLGMAAVLPRRFGAVPPAKVRQGGKNAQPLPVRPGLSFARCCRRAYPSQLQLTPVVPTARPPTPLLRTDLT